MRKYLRGIPEKFMEQIPPEGIGYLCLVRDILGQDKLPPENRIGDWEQLFKDPSDALLSGLPARERELLALRYGIEDGEPYKTYNDIGVRIKRSEERVRQICEKALNRLRDPSYLWYLEALYDENTDINLKDASERFVEALGLYFRKPN